MHDIDITTEDTMTLAKVRSILPPGRNASGPRLSTLIRWITVEVAGLYGCQVRLGAVRLGSKCVTTRQAIQRFTAAFTPRLRDTALSPSRNSKQLQRAAQRTAKQLSAVEV